MSSALRHRPTVFVFDLARALSALCVLAAHARGFVLADLPEQPRLSAAGRAFFGLTALGHQAVVVFLVLSGVLVTGSVLAAWDAGRWSALDYALARLNRLWIVLLPCLMLGALEDGIGILVVDPMATGGYGAEAHAQNVLARLDATTLAGNAVFLQGFKVPVFGSNIPLWTLSVEAWCYAVLGVATVLWAARREGPRFAGTAALTMVVAALVSTPGFWLICPIWGFGAVLACWFRARDRVDANCACIGFARWQGGRRIVATGFVSAALVAARVLAASHLALSDYLLAVAVVLALAGLRNWQPRDGLAPRLVRTTAGFSYSLYLSHFPLLAVFDALVLHHRRLPWGGAALALWIVAIGLALLQALAVWWLFERHTAALRAVWAARLRGGARRLSTVRQAVLP